MWQNTRILNGDGVANEDTSEGRRVLFLEPKVRFYVGREYSTQIESRGSSYDLLLLNRFVLEDDQEIYDDLAVGGPREPDKFTKVVIAEHSPLVTRPQLGGMLSTPRKLPNWLESELEPFIEVYRRLVVAISRASETRFREEELWGLQPPLEWAPDYSEFYSQARGLLYLITPKGFDLTIEQLKVHSEEVFSKPYDEPYSMAFHFPDEQVRFMYGPVGIGNRGLALLEESLRQQSQYLFHEIAHQAESELSKHRYDFALLLATMALEAAHAALLHQVLPPKLVPPHTESQARRIVNNLLREQGIFTLVQVTPFLYLSPDRQPSKDQLKAALDGLQDRNTIMHAKTSAGGQYQYRGMDVQRLRRSASGVLDLYSRFRDELENS